MAAFNYLWIAAMLAVCAFNLYVVYRRTFR